MQKKNTKLLRHVITALMIVFVIAAFICYAIRLYSDARQQAYRELQEYSMQVETTVQVKLDESLASIRGMANGFAGFDDLHSEEAVALLNRLNQDNGFTRMCVATADGIGIYDDRYQVDLSQRPYFKNAMKGHSGISELVISQYSGDVCFVTYAPIYEKDGSAVRGMMYGTYEPEALKKVISVNSYENSGGTYLFTKSGEYITSSANPGNLKMGDDTFTYFDQTCELDQENMVAFRYQILEENGGFLSYTNEGKRYLAYYLPLNDGKWYLMCVASNAVVEMHIKDAAEAAITLLLCCMIAFLVLMLNYIMEERRIKKAVIQQLQDKQNRITEQYANEIRNSYDAIYEFDYGHNRIYTYEFTPEGFERRDTEYRSLSEAIEALQRDVISNIDIGDIKDYFSEKHLDQVFAAGKNELNVDVQKRRENGEYNWYTLFTRKVHWGDQSDRIAMFYIKNVNDLYQEQRKNHQILLDALKMAKKASHAKSDFLARMSHDIRTPMNAIMGMTTIAKSNLDDRDRVADCIDKIDQSSQYLLSLINDILDMSRIESGKMELMEEDLVFNDIFRNLALLIRPEADKKHITYVDETGQDESLVVYADRLHLQQIFMNLVSNAVKYTPEGGRVCISAEQIDESEHHITFRFRIQDTGIGIEQDKQDVIFTPFERAGIESQNGTGLGLSIAHDLLSLMNGVITVESTIGVGTTFTVEIPFRKAEKLSGGTARSDADSQEGEVDFAGKRVLLAEDNDINMEIARIFLENVNLKVDTAENGEVAWNLYRNSEEGYYQAVITDIRMPVMNGRELTENIRKSGRADAQKLPVIAMSADAFSEEIQLSQSIGMNDYVTKPILPENLYQTLKKYL
ncbi:MAG: ATP-binding protein [bacterium]|nr:ATP-binding protein [bacterium]